MMAEVDNVMVYVIPREVLSKVSDAIPPECKKNMIIIGSLAAGFQYEKLITGMCIWLLSFDTYFHQSIEDHRRTSAC